MSRRLIGSLGRAASRRPIVSLLIVAVLTALAVWTAVTRLRIEMDVATLLPADSEVARNTRIAEWEFGRQDYLLGVVEIKDTAPEAVRANSRETLLAIRAELEESLFDRVYIRRLGEKWQDEFTAADPIAVKVARLTGKQFDAIEETVLPTYLDETLTRLNSLLAGDPTSETLSAIRRDPFGIDATLSAPPRSEAGPLRAEMHDGIYLSPDDKMMILLIWPAVPSTDLVLCRQLRVFLNQTVAGLYDRNPAWRDVYRISFTGPHLENAEGESDIRTDIVFTSAASFLAVLVLFFVAFRQPEALIFVAVPLAVGVTWTLGAAALFVDRITQVTLGFAAIMIGLGIDFSIHLYNRYIDELRHGASTEVALSRAILLSGPSIVAGAITTGMAFFGMMLTRFEGFRQLGLFGGLGIIICLVANAATLPPLILLFSWVTRRARIRVATFGLKKVTFTIMAYPRMTVAAGLCVAVYLGFYGTRTGFDEDFQNLQQPSDSYVELLKRIEEHVDLPGSPVLSIIEAGTLEEALRQNDRLYENMTSAQRQLYDLVSIDSLRLVFPSEETQSQNLARFASLPISRIRARVAASLASHPNIPADLFDEALARLDAQAIECRRVLRTKQVPITLAMTSNPAFYEAIQNYVVRDEGVGQVRIITRLHPRKGIWPDGIPPLFLEQLNTRIPGKVMVLGNDVLAGELRGVITRDLALVILVIAVGISLYLIFHFEYSLWRTMLAILPAFFALLCTLGMMNMAGIEFNYLNVIAIPMLIGVGVDSSVHILDRYFEGGPNALRMAIERTGRAIVITSLTTIFGFGSLCVASFQGIREIGLLAIAGTVTVLFATVILLPAILRLMDPEITYQGGEGDEIG